LERSILVPGVVPVAEVIFADDVVTVRIYNVDKGDFGTVSALDEGGGLEEHPEVLDGGRCRGRAVDP
jgi:hypothetical protein